MLVIETGQVLAIATLMVAGGGALVAYFNAQTNQLGITVAALKALLDAKDKRIADLEAQVIALNGRMDTLHTENIRLMAELVANLRKSNIDLARRANAEQEILGG